MIRKHYQLKMDAYLYKYAFTLPEYNAETDCFRVPFVLQLPIVNGFTPVEYYFKRVKYDDTCKVMLVDMYKGSQLKLYALIRYLDQEFVNQMIKHLITAKAFGLSIKDTIIAYRDHYGISEREYSFERAKKRFQRYQDKLYENQNFNYLKLDGIRPAPKRKRRGDMPDTPIQHL